MVSSSPLYVTFSELRFSPASFLLRDLLRRNELISSILQEPSDVARI